MLAAVRALKEGAEESDRRADLLRSKIKEIGSLREGQVRSAEERQRQLEKERNQLKEQLEAAHLEILELRGRVKEVVTELQATKIEKQHLIEELERQQIKGITGGTGSLLGGGDLFDAGPPVSFHSSEFPQEEEEEESQPFSGGTGELQGPPPPPPPPFHRQSYRRSIPNSYRPVSPIPHPPVSNGGFKTPEKAPAGHLEQIISQQSHQLIVANYELERIGRERYYEARLSEQKQQQSELKARTV